MAKTTYDDVEHVLAEIITEAIGEPRVGRLERTLAKSALARLREVGLTLPTPAAEDQVRAAALAMYRKSPQLSMSGATDLARAGLAAAQAACS